MDDTNSAETSSTPTGAEDGSTDVAALTAELDRVRRLYDEATAREAELAEELDKERARADHLREHWVDCEQSRSYRIGHVIVRTAKAPGRLVSSIRSRGD